ncbi:ECF transporter S component [Pyrococcus yayanosii]|nr:membrane protein [Pyrococcus yayanosii]
MNAKEVALTALMAATGLVLQVSPLKFKTPWGMNIDLVAVPIVLLYFLTGLRTAIFGLAVLALGISLVSTAGPLGASMKFAATLSVLLGLEVAKRLVNDVGIKFFALGYATSVAIRGPLMLVLNYYFALPLWLGVGGDLLIRKVEEMTGLPFWLAIVLPNAIQTVVDILGAAWIATPVAKRLGHII